VPFYRRAAILVRPARLRVNHLHAFVTGLNGSTLPRPYIDQ
jgi:hypothetical protein